MNIGGFNIPFEFFVVGFVVLFIVLVILNKVIGARRFAALTTRLDQEAMERGWTYQGSRSGGGSTVSLTFSGAAEGISWQMEAYCYHRSSRSGSTNIEYTRWWTDSVTLPGEVVMLMPHAGVQLFKAASTASTGLVGTLIQFALRYFVTEVLHAEPEDAKQFENIQEVQAGSDALRKRYTVLATSEATASRFLDEDAEQNLLAWATPAKTSIRLPGIMAVAYWHRGINVTVERQIVDMAKLEALVGMGLALASGQKSSVWS